MDTINEKILDILKTNGRASASEISKAVSLSIPAVAERIRKMESTGVIEKYAAKLNRKAMGKYLTAFVFVSLTDDSMIRAFRKRAAAMPAILECHHTAGSYDYLLKVSVADTDELEACLSELKDHTGIKSTNTVICLSTIKEEIN